MTQEQRFKVYAPAQGDVLRTPAGAIRYFATKEEAEAAAREEQGFVQRADAPSPAGFDRTWS
ncbi:MAG: hypothetical protein ACR2PL_03830 [Dehalococcoidia bacterium]